VTTIDSPVTVSVCPCPNDGGQRWGGGSSSRLSNRRQLALGRRGGAELVAAVRMVTFVSIGPRGMGVDGHGR
jgi:hypothetical protein